MLRLWGTLDGLSLVYYIAMAIAGGRIPFVSAIERARTLSVSFESAMPLVISALSIGLLLSMFVSAYALWCGRRFGQPLVYGQFAFRLVLAMPSVFFIPWLLRPLSRNLGFIVFIVLVLGTETWKLITVNRAYRRQPSV